MITEEEKRELITEIKLELIYDLPKIISNLMESHALTSKTNKKFYLDYPEFKGYERVVAAVVEKHEGLNTLEDYPTVLEGSLDDIRATIKNVKKMDMDKVRRPGLDIAIDHGEL